MNNENPEFNFVLNLNEANAILAALQELPAKVANPISDKIKSQAQEQIEKMQKVAAESVEAVE
jgi:hypothetical protein